jgi:hypothetical protein
VAADHLECILEALDDHIGESVNGFGTEADMAPFVPLEAYDDEPRLTAAKRKTGKPKAATLELVAFTPSEVLAPIAPEKSLLPGIPADAYTLIAGGLATYKTTLLIYMIVWKATGFDLLGLDPKGGGCDIGRCVLATYEDTDAKIFAKLQRVIQHGHRTIAARYGRKAAEQFVSRAADNIRRIPLAGKCDSGIVRRANGQIVQNMEFLLPFVRATRAFAPEGALIGIDPLRLAITGSQNDDDGADVVVHTLNWLANETGSGVVVCSHANKTVSQESAGGGYADAAYATAGSALYSQHARSNFQMVRLKRDQARKLFDANAVTPAEIERQHVAKLTHGRLSHGTESAEMYLVMRNGTLERVEPIGSRSVVELIVSVAGPVIAAIDRIRLSGVRVSADALEHDDVLKAAVGGVASVRKAVKLLGENNYIESTGATRDRDTRVTEKGRAFVSGENRGEMQGGRD